jgi:hypothetical protein
MKIQRVPLSDWQRSYRHLYKSADIRTADGERKRCHPHMFRDTFAVEMLLVGVPIDQVSLLFGHASVKITEELCALCKSATGSVTESVRNAWKLAQSPRTGPEGKPPAISVAEDKRTGWKLIRSRKKRGTPRLTTRLKNHL